MQPEPGGTPGYEFNATENRTIDRLATLMRVTGVVQMVVGVLQVGGFIGRTAALREEHPVLRIGVDVPVAVAFVAGGLLLFLAAPHFREVVRTEGNDIDHIMTACRKLSTLMTTVLVSFSVATVVWLIVFVIFLVTGTPLFGAASGGE